MPFDMNFSFSRNKIKRKSTGPILYYVNIQNIKNQLIEDIKNNFFDNEPHIGTRSCATGIQFAKRRKLTSIKYHTLQRVEQIDITEEDLEKEFLLMPFHLKLHDIDTGQIIFDDGKEVLFETHDEAKTFINNYLNKEMNLLNNKVKSLYPVTKNDLMF